MQTFRGVNAESDYRYSSRSHAQLKAIVAPASFDKPVKMCECDVPGQLNVGAIHPWLPLCSKNMPPCFGRLDNAPPHGAYWTGRRGCHWLVVGIDGARAHAFITGTALIHTCAGMTLNFLSSGESPNPRELQLNLTGFLEKKAGPFVAELWEQLHEAAAAPNGIVPSLLEARKAELLRAQQALGFSAERAPTLPELGLMADPTLAAVAAAAAAAVTAAAAARGAASRTHAAPAPARGDPPQQQSDRRGVGGGGGEAAASEEGGRHAADERGSAKLPRRRSRSRSRSAGGGGRPLGGPSESSGGGEGRRRDEGRRRSRSRSGDRYDSRRHSRSHSGDRYEGSRRGGGGRSGDRRYPDDRSYDRYYDSGGYSRDRGSGSSTRHGGGYSREDAGGGRGRGGGGDSYYAARGGEASSATVPPPPAAAPVVRGRGSHKYESGAELSAPAAAAADDRWRGSAPAADELAPVAARARPQPEPLPALPPSPKAGSGSSRHDDLMADERRRA